MRAARQRILQLRRAAAETVLVSVSGSIARASGSRASLRVRELLIAGRTRAYDRLRLALGFPIAIVAAPAGFGKSAVVREYLARERIEHRFVGVAPDGAGVLGVLHAFADACGDRLPALASSFVTVHDRLADATDGSEQLAAWAAGHLSALDGLIVLDGLDEADEVLGSFVGSLVDRTAGRLRWVLVARSAQHLPVARWLAADRLDLPVDAADLAFSADDLRAACAGFSDAPDARERAELQRLAGGWPAATALALAIHRTVDPLAAPLDAAARYEFLAESVLSALSPPSRAFVERTCLFRGFDRALLECAGFDALDEVLAELCEDVGILGCSGSGVYEYERNFQQVVIRRLRDRGAGAFELVAAASAEAYRRDERYAAMIDVYLLLGDEEALCRLLTTHGFALIDRGDARAVQRALAVVPHEILLGFPGALAVKASLESLHGKIDVAEAWFRLALDRITSEHQRNEIVYRFGADLVRRERPDAIDILAPVVASIDEAAVTAAPLMALLATAYASARQSAAAAATMERALRLLPRVDNRVARAKIVCQAGYVALHLHDIPAAKAFAQRAYDDARAAYAYDIAARALSVLYNIAIDYEDDVAASCVYLQLIADCSGHAGSRELLLYAVLCRYEIEVYRGNLVEIEHLNAQLASLEVFYSVLATETLLPSQALQAGWSGDFERAYRLLESSAEDQVSLDRRAHRYAEISVYAAAAGLRQAASTAAERALDIVRHIAASDKTALTARVSVALTFVLLRRRARAEKLLRDLDLLAAANSRVLRLVRAVRGVAKRWERGAEAVDFATLLADLEAADLGGIARLIEALPLPETTRSAFAQVTAAEREILAALGAGQSSRAIAQTTGRSVQTIDAHVASICRKLGCASRREALAIAVAEGLLEPAPELAAPAPLAVTR